MERLPISSLRVPLAKGDLFQMLGLVRLCSKLLKNPTYRQFVAADLPESARFHPGHAGVMMGYDFHLTSDGPRLIEVNTNAGGAALALRACQGEPHLTPSLRRRLRRMFLSEWQGFNAGQRQLQTIVILDENPLEQALYPEMKCFADWLKAEGLTVLIADPSELEIDDLGVRLAGKQVDLIYNRHCDFYLADPSLAAMRNAYLKRRICLTPNPFVYGHLADKRRMILWSQPEQMTELGLSDGEVQLLQKIVPPSQLLADIDPAQAWTERKSLAFKPVDRFGSKGVLLGKSMSRKRFAQFDPQQTLVQQLVPPSQISDEKGNAFKVDLRLYAWRGRALGVAARLYQGQVTNLRTVGGGFAAVELF